MMGVRLCSAVFENVTTDQFPFFTTKPAGQTGYSLAVQTDLHQQIAGNSEKIQGFEYFSIIYYSE
jgi:hypothetical protein